MTTDRSIGEECRGVVLHHRKRIAKEDDFQEEDGGIVGITNGCKKNELAEMRLLFHPTHSQQVIRSAAKLSDTFVVLVKGNQEQKVVFSSYRPIHEPFCFISF